MTVDEELAALEEDVVDKELSEYLTKIRNDLDRAFGRIAQLESHAKLSTVERELESQVHALGPPYHTCSIRLLDGGRVVLSSFHDGGTPRLTTVEKLRAHISNSISKE